MNWLLDPNIGYVLLVGGTALAIVALIVPGTGLLELAAFFALFMAGYVIVNLPVNAWAIGVLLAALIVLGVAVRWRKGGLALLSASTLLLFVGSLFVFPNPSGGPAVNPFVAVVMSGGLAGLVWLAARKSLDASALRPRHDPDRLLGQSGVARTDLNPNGAVYAGGENWSARSSAFIAAGSAVRILKRDGLVLEVEEIQKED